MVKNISYKVMMKYKNFIHSSKVVHISSHLVVELLTVHTYYYYPPYLHRNNLFATPKKNHTSLYTGLCSQVGHRLRHYEWWSSQQELSWMQCKAEAGLHLAFQGHCIVHAKYRGERVVQLDHTFWYSIKVYSLEGLGFLKYHVGVSVAMHYYVRLTSPWW